MDALRWWHSLLLEGRRLPVVGGSDFHRDHSPVQFAHPTTMVYADSPAVSHILTALRQGHSYITSSVHGVRLDILNEALMFGMELQPQPGRILQFQAENGKTGQFLQIVTDRGIAAEQKLRTGQPALLSIPEQSWRFAYLRVVRKLPGTILVCAISNPIYFFK